jgi:hypothetical protein
MPERPEIAHFGNCPVCGALVDMRDLAQVFAHMHGQVPVIVGNSIRLVSAVESSDALG